MTLIPGQEDTKTILWQTVRFVCTSLRALVLS